MIKHIFIALLFSFLLLPQKLLAAEEFATSYDVVYDIDQSGLATVSEKISLRNLTSESYASKFMLTIGATEISDIKASDPGGALEATSTKEGNLTKIEVKFNQQVAGSGKVLAWALSFKSKDFAEKVGKVWEVRAPRIAASTNLEDYNLTLVVPQEFGEPSQITPVPKKQTVSQGKLFLTFDKSQLQSSGVSANFGSFQLFDFDLKYNLQNNNLMPILTNVALPPDTGYQDVVFRKVAPRPINVTIDADGNYLAWYKLDRSQKLTVEVIGSVRLYAKSKMKNSSLSNDQRVKYTRSQKFWDKDNPAIQSKVEEILSQNPKGSNTDKARLIYQFVVNNLKYNVDRLKDANIERLGAVTALMNSDAAVCMEFTDLFIALARAAGIPARELNGYAHTTNPQLRPLLLSRDILHSWPEYWDEKRGWVMIDPTWGNTTGGVDYFSKLDLNHVVFAIRGMSSEQPVAAGSYKFDGIDSRDVKVSLSENDFLGKPQPEIDIALPDQLVAGFSNNIKVKIVNKGNAFFPSQTLNISATRSNISPATYKTGVIPAWGSAEFETKLKSASFFDSYDEKIQITLGQTKISKDIRIATFLLFKIIPLGIGTIGVLMVVIYMVVLSGHFYKLKIKKK